VERGARGEASSIGEDNVFKEITIARGDLVAATPTPTDRRGEYCCGHQEQLYIENNGMIAERTQEGGISCAARSSARTTCTARSMRVFALPPDKVRVVADRDGGGFGGKEEYPSMIGGHAALLAWKSGPAGQDHVRPARGHRRHHQAPSRRDRVRAGVKRDGTLRALEIEIVMDGGAYVTLSPVVLSRGAIHAGGPYRCPNVKIHARAVATSTPPNGAFRGFGAPQTQFAMECHMDRIAAELKLDPVRCGARTRTGSET
jgi:CO/xanthine dehydrogenase Mo-binding subunit